MNYGDGACLTPFHLFARSDDSTFREDLSLWILSFILLKSSLGDEGILHGRENREYVISWYLSPLFCLCTMSQEKKKA